MKVSVMIESDSGRLVRKLICHQKSNIGGLWGLLSYLAAPLPLPGVKVRLTR